MEQPAILAEFIFCQRISASLQHSVDYLNHWAASVTSRSLLVMLGIVTAPPYVALAQCDSPEPLKIACR